MLTKGQSGCHMTFIEKKNGKKRKRKRKRKSKKAIEKNKLTLKF